MSLQRIPAAGGLPEPFLSVREGEISRRWPQILPNGKALLYTTTRTAGSYDDGTIVAEALPKGEGKTLVRGGYFGRYLPSGHLVYMHQGTLFAVAMDQDRLETHGQPKPVLEHVAGNSGLGFGQFAASAADAFVYVPGQAGGSASPVLWADSSGKTSPLRSTPADWSNIRFSPDGQRVAVDLYDGSKNDIHVYEWTRDTLARLTVDASDNQKPAWTPDGRRIVFRSNRDGRPNLYWQRADGAGAAQRLTTSEELQMPGSWHPTGKFLAFSETVGTGQGGANLMILPMDGDETSGWKPGKPYVFATGSPGASDPISRPTGAGSRTSRWERRRRRSSCSRFLVTAASARFRATAAFIRRGRVPETSCISSRSISKSWWRPIPSIATPSTPRNLGAGRTRDSTSARADSCRCPAARSMCTRTACVSQEQSCRRQRRTPSWATS